MRRPTAQHPHRAAPLQRGVPTARRPCAVASPQRGTLQRHTPATRHPAAGRAPCSGPLRAIPPQHGAVRRGIPRSGTSPQPGAPAERRPRSPAPCGAVLPQHRNPRSTAGHPRGAAPSATRHPRDAGPPQRGTPAARCPFGGASPFGAGHRSAASPAAWHPRSTPPPCGTAPLRQGARRGALRRSASRGLCAGAARPGQDLPHVLCRATDRLVPPARGAAPVGGGAWPGRYSCGSTPARSRPYAYASSSACQEAAITFSATPTVDHSPLPSAVETSTRVVDSVPCLPSRMRTL